MARNDLIINIRFECAPTLVFQLLALSYLNKVLIARSRNKYLLYERARLGCILGRKVEKILFEPMRELS
jgi:hypothetical protein